MSVAAPHWSGAALRARFDDIEPLTLGLEEEVMLLDPDTLDLSPRAEEVLELIDGGPGVKPELPAAHIELVTQPAARVQDAIGELAAARRTAAARTAGVVALAAAGVHPFTAPLGVLSARDVYAPTRDRYGAVARLQLVCALQVHVAVGGAERTLAVYNALRAHLPELAALGANAPFFAGADSGLASVRPLIGTTLPRQGVPPVIASWDALAADLEWGAAAGAMTGPGQWWWELRPHPAHGTLEIRVPDAQATVEHAGAIAAVSQCLVAWLSHRADDGALGAPVATWRIEENRWSALRDGAEGSMADLSTGSVEPTRERLQRLLGTLAPVARELGCARELEAAGELVGINGAARQRSAASEGGGARAAARWLAEVFVPDGNEVSRP